MRVLLKISWEMFSWKKDYWIDNEFIQYVADEIKEIKDSWIQIWIVLWAWNIMRWWSSEIWINRTEWDNMWMLATTINSIYLSEILEYKWVKTKILNSFDISLIWEKFFSKKAKQYLEEWYITIFAWWTWNPYFTTDTAWVLRALESGCDIIIKATKVDWVYDKDPKKYNDAVLIKEATYDEVITKNLKVMDMTAIIMAKESNLKIKVVNLNKKWAMLKSIIWEEWTTIN